MLLSFAFEMVRTVGAHTHPAKECVLYFIFVFRLLKYQQHLCDIEANAIGSPHHA